MKLLETRTALTAIVLLLGGHLLLNVAQTLIQPAWAASTMDCRIVGIKTYDKLPVKIADVDTRDSLNVKMEWTSMARDALHVKVVEWKERDAIPVKIAK